MNLVKQGIQPPSVEEFNLKMQQEKQIEMQTKLKEEKQKKEEMQNKAIITMLKT